MKDRTKNDLLTSNEEPFTIKAYRSALKGLWRGVLSQMQGFCLALHRRRTVVRRGLGTRQVTQQLDKTTAKNAKLVELSLGKFAIVDADDFERLSIYKWCAVRRNRTWYAKTLRPDGSHLSMHRLIAGAPKHLMVDHKDHNGLNNRKPNLRPCTNAENQYNRLPHRGGTSRHKGVHLDRQYNKYRAIICHKSKKYHLGRFDNADDAARAYDKKARELFGEFAYLNFPNE